MLSCTNCLARLTDRPFGEAKQRLLDGLRRTGFRVVADVDMTRDLRSGVGVQIEDYAVLVAEDAALAHRALQVWRGAGLAGLINVALYDVGPYRLAVAPDPVAAVADEPDPGLLEAALRTRQALDRAMEIDHDTEEGRRQPPPALRPPSPRRRPAPVGRAAAQGEGACTHESC